MVLYHGMNVVNMLKSILHHMVYHPNEKCILIGSFNENYKKFDNVEHCIHYKKFDNGPWGNGVTLKGKELDEYTINYFDKELKERNIILEDISELYIGSYHGNFANYLQLKEIQHHFAEEAPGGFQHNNNKFIIKRYGTLALLKDTSIDKNTVVNYEVHNELYKLNDIQKNQIINFFNVPKTPIGDFDVLLLSEWWQENNWAKRYNNDDIIFMYGIVFDYYIPNQKVYIKPHPSDLRKDDYTKYFTDCEIQKDGGISELMGLIPNIHFKKAITISSTAIATVGAFSDELISIGDDFRNQHFKIFKYEIACELANFLNEFKLDVVRYGIYERVAEIFKRFFENIPNGNCTDNDKIVISDEFYLMNPIRRDKGNWHQPLEPDEIQMKNNATIGKFIEATENTNNCFIITNNFEEIFDKVKRDANNIIVIKISKEKVKHICGANLQNEYIYVFCKNIEIRNKVQEFVFEKHLFQTGINITAKPMTLSETQMHYETVDLASKQIELKNEVKNLTNSLNESKNVVEQTKLELNKLNEKFNSLEKIVNNLSATDNKTGAYKISQKVDNIENKMTEIIPIEKKLQSIENNINKKFDVILKTRTNEYYKTNGQLKWARGEIDRLRNSFSYKLGRALTWLPRKILGLGKGKK